MRKVAVGVITSACVVLWVLIASAVWDYNENRYDAKMESQLIWDYIRHYKETHDPDTIIYPYIGSTKTKTFHIFESECAREIRSTQLKGFDSREDALNTGYSRCKVCKP